MADDFKLDKEELAKKLTRKSSIDDAFDSDSSAWSDDEENVESNANADMYKEKVAIEAELKKVDEGKNPVAGKFAAKTNPAVEIKTDEARESKSNNQQQLSLAAVIESEDKTKKDDNPAKLVVKAEIIKEHNSDEDDNWDDDDAHSFGEGDVKQISKPMFQTSSIPVPLPTHETGDEDEVPPKDNNSIDWSPSESIEDVVYVEDEGNDIPEDKNIPQIELKQLATPVFTNKSQSVTNVNSVETIQSEDEDKTPVSTLFQSKRAVQQESGTSVESKEDNFRVKMENATNPANSDESLLGRNTSSAHLLFQASADSVNKPPSTLKSVESIERDTEVAEVPSTTKLKSSKPSSSGKRFLSKFLSSDSSNSKKATSQQLKRKSSEPTPLSKLLLDTPVKSISSAKSTNDFADSADRVSDDQGDANLKNSLAIPAKPNTFMKKMKRTFGVGLSGKTKSNSKSSSLSAAGEPSIPFDQDDGVITVPMSGKSTDDIIIQLLTAAKKVAEQSYLQHSDGGGDAQPIKQDGKRLQRSTTRSSIASMGSRASSEHSLETEEEAVGRRKSTSKMPPLPHYCATAQDHAPNRQIMQAILNDLGCVIERSLGHAEALEGGYTNLGSELDQLRAELQECRNYSAELERKVQELECALQQAQLCLDEQCEARATLEKVVSELRAQLSRQDECLDELCAEKADFIEQIKHLEVLAQNMENQVCDFETVRQEHTITCRGFEQSKGRCTELQQALAQCCAKCDELQRELLQLRGEGNDAQLKLDTCMFEKNKLMPDIDCMKQQMEDQKACMEAEICKLLEENARLSKAKDDTCRRMNEILAAHHDEMDRLNNDSLRFKSLLEEEQKRREELERKLRDCEENKRKSQAVNPVANQAQIESLKNEAAKYRKSFEEQKKATEESERKRRDSEDKTKKAMLLQQETIQLVQQQAEQSSKDKIEKLTNETEKYKDLLDEERNNRQTLERQVRDLEDQKQRSFQDKEQLQVLGNIHQQTQEFYSNQKIELLKTELDKYKNLYDDEKKGREDAERKIKDSDDSSKLKSLHEQQLAALQIQHQQQESLSEQKLELVKKESDKASKQLEEEKRTREILEQKLRDLEDEKLKNSQEHQQALQHQQQQLEYYSQQRLDLLKNDLERNKFLLEEEKRAREELERRLRDADGDKQKIMLEHQAAVQKLQEQYSQLQTIASQQSDEDKAVRGVWQRELRDAQRLWETEVKAKGILAEKLARLEKQQGIVENKTKRELDELEYFKDKLRSAKLALRNEKDLVIRLTNKLEETKNVARTYKTQVDEMANGPKTQKLLAVVESLRSQFELHSENARQEKEKLMDEIYKLNREKWNAERQSKKLVEEMRILDAEKSTWQNLAKMKDRIEIELVELKRAVNDQFVDKRDVERIRNVYENKLHEIKSRYEQEVQSQVSLTLSQFTTQLGKQTRDRQMLEKIRDSNENTLRAELSTVSKSMQSDVDKFKSIVSERDEEIVTLRKSLDIVNEKYANESRQRESLMRRLHILSTQSQDALGQVPSATQLNACTTETV